MAAYGENFMSADNWRTTDIVVADQVGGLQLAIYSGEDRKSLADSMRRRTRLCSSSSGATLSRLSA
jgi:hypothetical protein